jgi:hypothetical protein
MFRSTKKERRKRFPQLTAGLHQILLHSTTLNMKILVREIQIQCTDCIPKGPETNLSTTIIMLVMLFIEKLRR